MLKPDDYNKIPVCVCWVGGWGLGFVVSVNLRIKVVLVNLSFSLRPMGSPGGHRNPSQPLAGEGSGAALWGMFSSGPHLLSRVRNCRGKARGRGVWAHPTHPLSPVPQAEPTLIGIRGFVVVFTQMNTYSLEKMLTRKEAKARNIRISSPQVRPYQHCGERLLDSPVCVLNISLFLYLSTLLHESVCFCMCV